MRRESICKQCNKLFITMKNESYCGPECRKKAKREYDKSRIRTPVKKEKKANLKYKKKKPDLTKDVLDAENHGMSYGQWMAFKRTNEL